MAGLVIMGFALQTGQLPEPRPSRTCTGAAEGSARGPFASPSSHATDRRRPCATYR